MSHSIEGVSNDALACLNSWPEGTVGYYNEVQLIALVNDLCKKHGYGRMAQLVQGIEEIWRNPEEGGKKWQEFHDERMALLKGTIAHYQQQGHQNDDALATE